MSETPMCCEDPHGHMAHLREQLEDPIALALKFLNSVHESDRMPPHTEDGRRVLEAMIKLEDLDGRELKERYL